MISLAECLQAPALSQYMSVGNRPRVIPRARAATDAYVEATAWTAACAVTLSTSAIRTSKNPPVARRCHGMDRNKYTDLDVRVAKDTQAGTYDAWLGPERIGTLVYQLTGTRISMISIAVEREYQHHGVAAELIASALDDIAKSEQTVTIICPVVRSFIDEHPEYADLVDPARPGIRTRH